MPSLLGLQLKGSRGCRGQGLRRTQDGRRAGHGGHPGCGRVTSWDLRGPLQGGQRVLWCRLLHVGPAPPSPALPCWRGQVRLCLRSPGWTERRTSPGADDSPGDGQQAPQHTAPQLQGNELASTPGGLRGRVSPSPMRLQADIRTVGLGDPGRQPGQVARRFLTPRGHGRKHGWRWGPLSRSITNQDSRGVTRGPRGNPGLQEAVGRQPDVPARTSPHSVTPDCHTNRAFCS